MLAADLRLDKRTIDRDRGRHDRAAPVCGNRFADIAGAFGQYIPLPLITAGNADRGCKVDDQIAVTRGFENRLPVG
jgi:hypothetical protein